MRTKLLGVGVVSLILIGAMAAVPLETGKAGDVSECVAAAAWLEENRDNLPTTYDEVSTFSPFYRKVILANLPTTTRVAMWHEHLSRFVESNELTAAQKDFVREVDYRLEWHLSEARTDEEHYEAAREARAVLGEELARQAFFVLGPTDENALVGEACSCHISNEQIVAECPNGYACAVDGDSCDLIEDRCGFLGTQDCSGECLSP